MDDTVTTTGLTHEFTGLKAWAGSSGDRYHSVQMKLHTPQQAQTGGGSALMPTSMNAQVALMTASSETVGKRRSGICLGWLHSFEVLTRPSLSKPGSPLLPLWQ
jgi:hypothetical protein